MSFNSNLETVRLYDADDKLVAQVPMPVRSFGDPPRSTVYCGRRFQESEGGPGNYYKAGEFREVKPN